MIGCCFKGKILTYVPSTYLSHMFVLLNQRLCRVVLKAICVDDMSPTFCEQNNGCNIRFNSAFSFGKREVAFATSFS